MSETCESCQIVIDPSCDEAHLIEPEGEPYTVCDACYNDYLVFGRVPA